MAKVGQSLIIPIVSLDTFGYLHFHIALMSREVRHVIFNDLRQARANSVVSFHESSQVTFLNKICFEIKKKLKRKNQKRLCPFPV